MIGLGTGAGGCCWSGRILSISIRWPPAANGWGCEAGVTSRFVKAISSDANGSVTATVQNISTDVNDSLVTLFPLNSAGTAANSSTDMGKGISGWTCGGTGTTLNKKYLPGSCRGS